MLTRTRLVTAVLAAGALTAGGLILAAGGAFASSTTTTLHYSIKQTTSSVSETGKSGFGSGTEITAAGEVFSGSSRVGSYIVDCTAATGGNAELECVGTGWIGSGVNQLSFAGYSLASGADSVYAVTGGTGAYFGDHGQLIVDMSSQTAGTVTFQLAS